MSSAKQYNFKPALVINETAVGSSKTSSITDIYLKDNITYQLAWTGTLAGTFDIQVSSNYDSHNPTLANWDSLPLDPTPTASGSAGSWTIDLSELGSVHIKIVFTFSSGTGNLTARIMGKAL